MIYGNVIRKYSFFRNGESLDLPSGCIIECTVTDPKKLVKLYKIDVSLGNQSEIEELVPYDPVIGFNLGCDRNHSGVFLCRSEDEYVKISLQENLTSFDKYNHSGQKNTSLEVIDVPVLRFDYAKGAIDCLSSSPGKSITSIHCGNSNDCDLAKYCFDNEFCQKTYAQQFSYGESSESKCRLENENTPALPCISITNLNYNGIIQCSVLNKTKSFIFEFMTGLRLIKYSTWKNVPKDELLRMDEVNDILYANETSYFFCEGTRFPFKRTFHHKIHFKNDTTKVLHQGTDYTSDNSKATVIRAVYNFNFVSGIFIRLPIDAVKLTCYAYLAEELDTYGVSRDFSVKYLEKPRIRDGNKTVYVQVKTRYTLVCNSTGEPVPYLKWTKNGIILHSSNSTDGVTILDLPNITKESEGEYICYASNRVGEDYAISESKDNVGHDVTIIMASLAGFLIFVAIYLYHRHYQMKKYVRDLTDAEVDEFLNGNLDMWSPSNCHTQENIQYMPYNSEFEIPIQNLTFDKMKLLGTGEYGMIMTAVYNLQSVAIKTTKPGADILYFKTLLSELKIRIFIGNHGNIVSLIGACTEKIREKSIYIVYELCEEGNLENYLRKNRQLYFDDQDILLNINRIVDENMLLTSSDLHNWSLQIANAMDYLSSKNIFHGDLATRNVLLTHNRTAKVSDFGLAHKLYQNSSYRKRNDQPLPWRWMAPESLQYFQFSLKSDVWSYGVTIWEIFSLGQVPYPDKTWNYSFVSQLAKGARLDEPKYCSKELYSLMTDCWNVDPDGRPTFRKIIEAFELKKDTLMCFKDIMSQINMSRVNNRDPVLSIRKISTTKADDFFSHYTEFDCDE